MKRLLKIFVGLAIFAAFSMLGQFYIGNLAIKDGRLEAQSPPVPTRLSYSAVASTTLSTNSTMLSAPASNLRYYIYQAECVNTSSTAIPFAITDGSSTVIWRGACPPSAANGGKVNFDPPLRQPTAGTLVGMSNPTGVTTAYYAIRAYQDR